MTNPTNSINGLDGAQELLIKLVEQNPDDWQTRKKVVQVLYESEFYRDASTMVWSAPEIPPVCEDVIFAARVVSKSQPTRAMRLFGKVVEKNLDHPEENLAMAKLLVKAGMPYQAIRFYGAATALDSKLVDENFELCLVGADNDNGNWSELVSGEGFPWDGPEPMKSVESEDGDTEVEAYANLLNGATQPVPMKAPVRGKVERSAELPDWKVENTKTTFVSRGLQEWDGEVELNLPVGNENRDEDDILPADVSAASRGTPDVNPGQEREHARQRAIASMMDFSDQQAEEVAEAEKVIHEIVIPESVPVSEPAKSETEPMARGTFFKSYDDAHGYKESGVGERGDASYESPSVPPEARPATPVVDATAEAPDVVSEVNTEVKADDMSLSDYVADALAHYDDADEESSREGDAQVANVKERVAGVFSSIVNKFRHKPSDTPDEFIMEGEVLASTFAGEPVEVEQFEQFEQIEQVEQVEQVETPAVPVAQTQPVEPNPFASVSSVVNKPEPTLQSVPRELDGRTQLVSLAPQDGSAFFSKLEEKYHALSEGELPKPAMLARDMANVDYVDLVGKACRKDLDAFSKLLGLHRVMSGSNCGEWVEDMNLLRKGYGDAVLATVVSKYSVTECRDILNSVYSQAAAV
jgi:hypothetical protein